ncbi:MAG: hypothetical protein R3Y24_02380 [Eubacteriales bacterium]
MKNHNVELLKGIQKNAKMGMVAVDTMIDKVYDDSLAIQLSKQEAKYEKIYQQATSEIEKLHVEAVPSTKMQDMMLKGGIHMNTMLDCSNSHIAELMIKGNHMGVTDMWKNTNTYKGAEIATMELARELTDFEEKSIQQMRKYL